jgi:hypothetical protein
MLETMLFFFGSMGIRRIFATNMQNFPTCDGLLTEPKISVPRHNALGANGSLASPRDRSGLAEWRGFIRVFPLNGASDTALTIFSAGEQRRRAMSVDRRKICRRVVGGAISHEKRGYGPVARPRRQRAVGRRRSTAVRLPAP